MSGIDRRKLLPHAAIGVTVCLGSYMLLVDGARQGLVNARAEVSALTVDVRVAESLRDKVPAMAAALEKVSRRAESIAEKGRPARDERALYAAITALASQHHVRLDQLNPTRKNAAGMASSNGTTTTSGTAAPVKPAVSETAVGYNMMAIASFDDIAAFVASMRMDLGFSCIRSVRITPVQDEKVKLVHASIETEHYSFETTLPRPTTADAGAR